MKSMKSTIERTDEEEVLKILGEKSPVGVCIMQDGKFCYVNSNFPIAIGYAADELIGKDPLELIVPEDRKMVRENEIKMLNRELIPPYQFRVIHKDGSIRWVMEAVRSVQYHGRRAVLGHYMEVTERKQMEDRLKESEQKYRLLFETSLDCIAQVDGEGRYLAANPAVAESLGVPLEELIGKTVFEVMPQEVAQLRLGNMRKVLDEWQPQIFEDEREGRYFHHIVIPTKISEQKEAVQVITRDITERKQADVALQAEKNKLQSLIDAMDYTLTIQDTEYNIIYQSEQSRIASGGDHLGEKCYRVYEGREAVCEGCPAEKAFKDGKSHTAERMTTISGKVTFWENTANPIRDAEGKIVSCLELTQDVTKHKRAEETLQVEKNKLQSVIDAMADTLTIQDTEYNIIFQNELSKKSTDGDRTGEKCYRAYEGREKICEGCPVEKAFKDGKSHTAERRTVVSGEVAFWENTANPIRDASGEIVSCLEIARNITERKKQEQALADEATRRRILVDQSIDGIVVLDEDAKVYEANQRFAEMLGYTPEEVRELHTWDWDKNFPPEQILEMGRNVDEKGLHLETKHTRKDGSVIDVDISISGTMCGGQKLIFCVCRDITERKKMEEALRESEKKLRLISENSRDIICLHDPDHRYVYISPACKEILGYEPDELVGTNPWELVHPEDIEALQKEGQEKALQGMPALLSYRIRKKSGEYAWFESVSQLLKDGAGNVLGFVTSSRDITERKRAEEALGQSEEKYRTILEEMEDAYFEVDLGGHFTFVNNSGCRDLGYSREELIGMSYKGFTVKDNIESVFQVFNEVYRTGVPNKGFPWKTIRKDGSLGFAETSVSLLRDEKGEIIGFRGVGRDVTERKEAEEKLRQSRENYRALFDSSVIGALVVDAETMRVVIGNQAAAKMFGFSSLEEGAGVNPLDFVPPEEREKALELLKKEVFEQDSRRAFDLQTLTKDGRTIWISATGAKITHGGRLAGLLSFTDITERKQAEETLRQSEERYRTILEEMEDSYFEVDLGGHLTFANNSVCRDLGYSREELIGMSYKDFTIEDDIESVFKAFNEVYRTGVPNKGFPWKTIRKDGSHGFAETSLSPLRNDKGEIIGFRGVGRDITERKQAEEKLRQSEENYKTLFNSSVIGIYVLDIETMKVVIGNRAASEMAGFSSAGDGIGINPFDFIIPEEREQFLEMAAKEFEQDLRRTHEVRVVGKDGGTGWISIMSAKIMHEGRLAALVSFTDITERKLAEEALRQSEENYRVLFDSSVIGTIVLDAETMKILMVNQAAATMFGFSSVEEARGVDPLDFILLEDREMVLEIVTKELFEQDLRRTQELRMITKDGREIWISATAARIMHEGKLAGLISFTDITEQKKQREHLMMTDRLASLGELASGTAHELNNPLTSIIGFSQLLMEREVPDDIREDLELINNEAQRAASVTKNLLTFARKHAPEKQLNQINNIIEDVLKLRAYEYKANNIEVERQFAPNLPGIMADYFQIQQVFMNIIINAEYFMINEHNKGTLTITTKKQKDTVMISFADDGAGIPPESLRRIFDPFFTTKEAGKGTGLGLSICHGIVTEHGGQIYARNQQGKGATIFVELPINGH